MNKQTAKPVAEKTACSRMARICSQREYCSHDIRLKLQRMGLPPDAVERVIEVLKNGKYTDDYRFARSYIGDKLRFAKWGKGKIEFALKGKKIPEEIIGRAFSEFSDELLSHSLPPLLEKKLNSLKGKPEYEKRSKAIRFALNRGFSMQEILACLGEMPQES